MAAKDKLGWIRGLRRLLPSLVLVLILVVLMALFVLAMFAPDFSTWEAGADSPPVRVAIGSQAGGE